MKKCCRCKMMVPPRIRECPFCGAKYTNFEYFKMNWLPAAVAGVAVLIIGLNVADIMIFNKEIRSAVNEQQPDGQRLERLKEKYENKSSFKKKFIRYSELNIMTDNSNMREITEGDASVTVKIYSQSGSVSGDYKGEMIDGVPDGVGEFSYDDEKGKCFYEGEFSKGKIQGTGEMALSSGWTLRGSFFEGQLNGYGKKFSPSGVLTERGEFVNNQLNGRGIKYTWDGSVIFDGEFTYGLPSKFEYINLCGYEDIANVKNEDLVGKNIAVDGLVADLVKDEETGEEYFVMTAVDDTNVKFKVIDTGKSIQRRLQAQHKVYGYCESVGNIKDNMGTVVRGISINSFYSDR